MTKKLQKQKKIGKLQKKLKTLEKRLSAMEKREKELNLIWQEVQHLSKDIDRLKSFLPEVIWDKNLSMGRNSSMKQQED